LGQGARDGPRDRLEGHVERHRREAPLAPAQLVQHGCRVSTETAREPVGRDGVGGDAHGEPHIMAGPQSHGATLASARGNVYDFGMERVPMTPEGFAALKTELAELKAERPKISQMIGEAADHGDLKENAEYHAARE